MQEAPNEPRPFADNERRPPGSSEPATAGERVDFASSKARLGYLLRALFDVSPRLLGAAQGLATRRPFLSNVGLHLPEVSRALRGPAAGRWYDAASAHAAAHLRHSAHHFRRGGLKPIQTALVGLLEDARVELLASAGLPGLRRLWLGFHVAEPAHGGSFEVLMMRLARCLLDPRHDDPHPWVRKGRRLFFDATRGADDVSLLTPSMLREIASGLGHDIGQMRLQFNHREYVVEPAYRDDNRFLWQPDDDAAAAPPPMQALAEPRRLPPSGESGEAEKYPGRGPTVVDDDKPADRIAHGDVAHGSPRPEPIGSREQTVEPVSLAPLQYPEWDRLIGEYRNDWTTVLESRPAAGDPARLLAIVERQTALLRRLDQVLCAGRLRQPVRLRAQLRGDELDIDAALRSAVERRAGRQSPSQKVYQRLDRRQRDVAALVLLDSSASTADPLPGNRDPAGGGSGRGNAAPTGVGSVLDLAREAAWLTALTLVRAGDDCAIHAFASNGRHSVHYQRALDFDEPPASAAGMARLAGVKSGLSTRMGAALRHAARLLAARRSQTRLLLFITDGEPHDIDIHDRRYLVEDARRAVMEAGRLGLAVFCVNLDAAADSYVRKIFGAGNYRVLDRIESLPRILPAMVLRLTR